MLGQLRHHAAGRRSSVPSHQHHVHALASSAPGVLGRRPRRWQPPQASSSDGEPQQQQKQQQQQQHHQTKQQSSPAPSDLPASSPQPAQEQVPALQQEESVPSPWRELRTALAAITAFLVSLVTSLQRLPAWARGRRLSKLRDQSDEDPQDASKHAAYLVELNKVHPKEVLARVESKEYNTNAAVVIEYIRALVLSGKLSQYSGASAAQAATLAPAAAGGGAMQAFEGEDHRSLYQLLKDLQAQVARDQPDDTPGSSQRRPLHVTVSGLALPGTGAGGALPTRQAGGPLQLVWSLLGSVAVVVGLACVWLLGTQAVRRMQLAAQAASPSGAAAAAASSGSSSVASGGSPSLDPKEYKRDELPEKAAKSFKDVRGCDEAKEELKEVVEFLKNPARFTRLGAKLPKGVLLTGPPGTGKTLLARAVAGEAGVPFFYRAGSEFEELYVGVGSRRMRALFQAAKKKAPCIVFIDEIDAIGANRKSWDNHTRKTLNQLLVEMDGFEANEGVIVMAATNLAETLDPALKRPGRFDRQVAVPLPDLKGRQEILEYYLHDKPVSPLVEKDLLARQTQGFSGADLSNLINEAALLAAKLGADAITPTMLDSSFDKIRMGVERKSIRRTPESIKRTAYHEAGHALVATSTPGASPVHKATIVPRGHALGMVTQVGREDEFSINRQQMLARIWVCMGGQVAEELIFGKEQVTSGATDDLRQATEWARYMVAECGLDDEIGPVHVSDRSVREGALSEDLKQRIDQQVRGLLVEARAGVKALISSRLADLHALAHALMDQETLTAEQITSVLATGKLPDVPPSGGTEAGPAAGGGSGSGEHKGQPLEGVLASHPPQQPQHPVEQRQ